MFQMVAVAVYAHVKKTEIGYIHILALLYANYSVMYSTRCSWAGGGKERKRKENGKYRKKKKEKKETGRKERKKNKRRKVKGRKEERKNKRRKERKTE